MTGYTCPPTRAQSYLMGIASPLSDRRAQRWSRKQNRQAVILPLLLDGRGRRVGRGGKK